MKRSFVANESGIVLVTALLVLMIASAIMAGMFAALLADQRSHATDRDQSVAYAAAHAGLEKLTAGLAGLFNTDFSPSAAQVAAVATTPPAITGFVYTSPGGGTNSGYQITFTADPGPGANTGNPMAFPNTDITTGPFEGFKGLVTPYTITVTAKSTTGNSEVRLRRELQTVAVPVFQFGIFGEKSLGFHAGPNFDFGGRVHTNQSLFLANGTGNTLTFRDKITAFTQVVRNTLSNGRSITLTNHTGNVSIPKVIGGVPADYRNLLDTESSGTTAAPWGRLEEPLGGDLPHQHPHRGHRRQTAEPAAGVRGRDPHRPDQASPSAFERECGESIRLRAALLRAGQLCGSSSRTGPRTSPTCRRSRRVRRLT